MIHACQRLLHEGFGIGPWHQYPMVNGQAESPKFLIAAQIGDRNMLVELFAPMCQLIKLGPG